MSFDASGYFEHLLQSALFEQHLSHFVQAANRTSVVCLSLEDLGAPVPSILRAARAFGVEQVLVCKAGVANFDVDSALALASDCGFESGVTVVEGDLAKSAKCRCGLASCRTCKAWDEFQHFLEGIALREIVQGMFPGDAMGAQRVLPFGVMGDQFKIFTASGLGPSPTWHQGGIVDLLTKNGPAKATVVEVLPEAVIVKAPGINANAILGVASPGQGRVTQELRVVPTLQQSQSMTIPQKVSLWSAGRSWGPCKVSALDESKHWIIKCPTPILAVAQSPCLLVARADSPVVPIEVWGVREI